MLEKDMYDSWKSRMELYMLNRPHGRMILESVEQGPLIWPSVEVEGVTRLKKYLELSAAEAIQADYDVKATNIILQGLPPENSTLPALQYDLILSVIEQLKTQVFTCTKINQDNKQASTSYEHFQEIDSVKHTLSKYLKEKESFEQKIAILKDDLQKEESRNIDRELALEKETYSYVEQAFWSQYSVQTDEPTHSGITIVAVLKELPKVSMEKNIVILKLKEKIKASSGDVKERQVESKVEEIETKNLELDHRVTKLTAENNHLKQTYKQLFDSIKSSRVQSKEQCDDLINKVNLKSVEVTDLNARLQEKVLVITALKEHLKGKVVLTKAVSLNPIDPALLQVDVVPLVSKLRKNRTAHIDYIKHTLEEATTLRELIESERLLSPLNTPLAYACKYTRRIQELLMILQQTCPKITDLGTNLVAVTPKNKTKQVRRVALVSSASGSQSKDNTKKNRIRRTYKKAKETKLEDHPRKVKSSLNKASVVDSRASSSLI
nr:hypothetical protein [Tanacetum cinerariifolium]